MAVQVILLDMVQTYAKLNQKEEAQMQLSLSPSTLPDT